MKWDDARTLLAVAREGSFLGAARSLGVSHSTVARRVQLLSEDLGVQLIERLPGGLSLTPPGETLIASAELAEEAFMDAERSVMGRDAALRGVVRVAVPYLFATHLLMPVFAEFSALYGEIRLEVIASWTLADLARREADVAIRVTNTPPESAIGRQIARLTSGLYVAKELDLRRDAPPPYVGLDDGKPPPPWYLERFPAAPTIVRVNDHLLLLEAVAAGLGGAALPCCIAEKRPELRRISDVPAMEVGLWLLTHEDLRASARVRALMDFMTAALRERLP